MNKNLKLMLSLLVVIVASCSKSKELPDEKKKSACVLSESTRSGGSDIFSETFTYDDKNRVTKIVERNGGLVGTINDFTYSATEIRRINDGYTFIYKLGSNNKIVSDSDGFSYSYDDRGYLSRKSLNNGANYIVTINYTYTNDNLTKIVEEVFNNYVKTTYTDLFEYGSEAVPNNFIIPWSGDVGATDGEDGVLRGYFGKTSKNLLTKHVGRYESGRYTYTIDVDGNVTKTVIKNLDGSARNTVDHKYNCK